jgi:2-phosphoglycerate kinase
MIYLIGGAPRSGKSILGQQISAELKIGWISTDLLLELLRVKNDGDVKTEWNASAEAIRANARWFFPYLERFIWGASSLAENYLIEGVDFLPEHVAKLSTKYPIRAVFLGCSQMTLDIFDRFPGRSRGYSNLPEELRRQFARDVPLWSEFIRQESERFGHPYCDVSKGFAQCLKDAGAVLTANS